jgi:hypothetical protein
VAEETPTNAWVVVNGASYYPALFELDGKLYTQAIKVDSDLDGIEYCVSQFVLYKEVNGSEGVGAGDIVVFGTPQPDSDYEVYIDEDYRLPYCFTIEGFMKYEIPIEVLCFEEADYDYFGFFWFDITEIVIREACFFGDLCLENFSLWANELPYSNSGIYPDEKAYFKIHSFKAVGLVPPFTWIELPYSPVNNYSIYDQGLPLCVEYPDVLGTDETFKFELWIWVPQTGGGFNWTLYDIFYTTDNNPIPQAGNDGVVDFAVGTCSPNSFPIYTWLGPH